MTFTVPFSSNRSNQEATRDEGGSSLHVAPFGRMLLSYSAINGSPLTSFWMNMIHFYLCRREGTAKQEARRKHPLPEAKPEAWRRHISSSCLASKLQVFMIFCQRCCVFSLLDKKLNPRRLLRFTACVILVNNCCHVNYDLNKTDSNVFLVKTSILLFLHNSLSKSGNEQSK